MDGCCRPKRGSKEPPWAVNHKILSDVFPKRHKRLPERWTSRGIFFLNSTLCYFCSMIICVFCGQFLFISASSYIYFLPSSLWIRTVEIRSWSLSLTLVSTVFLVGLHLAPASWKAHTSFCQVIQWLLTVLSGTQQSFIWWHQQVMITLSRYGWPTQILARSPALELNR